MDKIPDSKVFKYGPWLVALAAALWATDAPFRKYLTVDLSSSVIVLMEHLLIAVLVLPLFLLNWREIKNLNWKHWAALVFIAFGGSALALVLFTQSFHHVSPTVAILLQKLQPLIAIALAAVFLKERLSHNFWIWALTALVGAYFVTFPSIHPGSLEVFGGNIGILLALGAAFFWAGSTVFGKYVLESVSFQFLTAFRFLLGAVFLLFLVIVRGEFSQIGTASNTDWLFVFIVAIIAGLLAQYIYYAGLRYTRASIATLSELLFPVAAIVVNWVFLGESLVLTQIAGAAVLVFAISRLSVENAKAEVVLK